VTAGCSFGIRYLCCADSQPPEPSGTASYCAYDHSTDDGVITVTKTVGDVCTRLHVIPAAANAPFAIPPGGWDVHASQGPCAEMGLAAIGGLGNIAFQPGDGGAFIDLHAALFFREASGFAAAVRMDVDALGFSASGCP
jgi:hypothetical protein